MSTPSPQTVPPGPILVCISGPDQGKRIAATAREAMLGRAPTCHLLSDDAEVAARHLALWVKDGKLAYRALADFPVFVDGQSAASGIVLPGQQLRVGRSYWQIVPGGPSASAAGLIERLSDHITTAAGLDKVQGFSLSETFSEVFKKRAPEEIEDHVIVGTRATTPPLESVEANWPKPWLFFRALAFTSATYGLFIFGWNQFHNLNLIPGLIMIGSLAGPFTQLIFFFEVNVARNVSLYQLLKLMLIGGVLSLIISLFGFQLTNLSETLGPPAAGIIEEVGKAAALLLVVNQLRYRWTLNGLLLGAAVGAGFAVFESAGYAFRLGVVSSNNSGVLFDVIQTRGFLTLLGGHVLWTAIVGAALWRVRGDRRFAPSMLADSRFLRVFAVAVVSHMVWDTSFELPLYLKYVALGFVVWVTLLSTIQGGLRQIKDEQLKTRSQKDIDTVRMFVAPGSTSAGT
jgi:RsiW-degrading membrane proteinase PrsW (M82 family)